MYTFSRRFSDFFKRPQTRKDIPTYLLDVVDILDLQDTQAKDINLILGQHGIQGFDHIKLEVIDLLLAYANYILEDSVITDEEAYDFAALKRTFRIKEGDFLQHRSFEVKEILRKEFIRIYANNFVDKKEDLEKVNLQAMFDLSYDQFEEIKKDEVIHALLNGANPTDLSIAKLPKGFRVGIINSDRKR